MKKQYIAPNTLFVRVNAATIISGSLEQMDIYTSSDQSVNRNDVWVKENRSDYNVWDDDWSK